MSFRYGKRTDFVDFLKNTFKKLDLPKKYADILMSPDSLRRFEDVFTSSSVDIKNNYEIYEQLGDVSINKFIVWYTYDRFPQLKTHYAGVRIAARIRINLCSSSTFSELAEKLHFEPYITTHTDILAFKRQDLLEDVFEAFFGCIEHILDENFKSGYGYMMISDMLRVLFDDLDISLKYEDLYDAKTRIKELFDYLRGLGYCYNLKYRDSRNEDKIFVSFLNLERIKLSPGKQEKYLRDPPITQGKGKTKIEAQQNASECMINILKSRSYTKPLPQYYNILLTGKTELVNTPERVKDKYKDINEHIHPIEVKLKHVAQTYSAPPIIVFATNDDIEGIKSAILAGADVNAKDSRGHNILDITLSKTTHKKFIVKRILTILSQVDTLEHFVSPSTLEYARNTWCRWKSTGKFVKLLQVTPPLEDEE